MKTTLKMLSILILLVFGLTGLKAQKAIVAVGGNAIGSGGSASFSVGQVAYTAAQGSNGSSNQGVLQPYEFFSVGFDENSGIKLQLAIYPNPTLSEVTLNIGTLNPKGVIYYLYDEQGRLLFSEKLTSEQTKVPMANLPSATYILKVHNKKADLQTFNIIKR